MKRPPRIYRADPTPPRDRWPGSGYEIRLSTSRAGVPLAHYRGRGVNRWFAMPRADAERLLAEGRATRAE